MPDFYCLKADAAAESPVFNAFHAFRQYHFPEIVILAESILSYIAELIRQMEFPDIASGKSFFPNRYQFLREAELLKLLTFAESPVSYLPDTVRDFYVFQLLASLKRIRIYKNQLAFLYKMNVFQFHIALEHRFRQSSEAGRDIDLLKRWTFCKAALSQLFQGSRQRYPF